MSLKRIIFFSSLFLVLLISVLYLLFFREEKLEDISIQVANAREMKDYDLTTMGESAKDNIYEKYDTVKFGRYYQGKFGYKKKSIDWIVLEKKEDRVLLMSKYILDSKAMKEGHWDQIYTWKNSDVRKWLNSDFLDIAFNNNEKEKIIEVQLKNKYESKTNDKVFLLNEEEFRKYFYNGMYYEKLNDPDYDNPLKERIGYSYEDAIEMQDYANATTVGTDYAFSQGLADFRKGWDDSDPFWGGHLDPINVQTYWLREARFEKDNACMLIRATDYDNIVTEGPLNSLGYGIRPAIWVSLKD